MKALCKSILFLALGAFAFTACEDVPAPYGIPTDKTEAGGDKDVLFEQSFKTSLGEFTSISASGSLAWIIDYSSACITGYKDFDGDGQKENQAGVTYLVSSQVDLTGVTAAHIELKHALNYERADINTNNSLLISKDYAGDVKTATWEVIPYNTDGLNSSFDFVTDKAINVPAAYMGQKVTFAFRHTCTDKQSSTWEVQEFKVLNGAAGSDEPETPADGALFAQSFKTTIAPFTSISKEGTLAWINDYSSAYMSGYKDFDGDGQKENQAGVTFLVSPEIDLAGVEKAYIELTHAINYERADINTNNSLVISKDFAGDVSTATWEALPYKTDGLNSSFTFVTDKGIVIPAAYMGQKVRIAFRHTCTDKQSSTWEVQELKVMSGEPEATPDTPVVPEGDGKGTLESPYTVDQIAKMTAATSGEVYVKGIISEIKSVDTGTYGNADYFISVDGTTAGQIKVFRGYFLEGAKFTSANQIKVGDQVVLLGQVAIYNGAPQLGQGNKIITLNSTGGGDDNTGGEVSGNSIVVDPTSFGLEKGPITTLTLTDGTSMTFDQNGGKTAPAYYPYTGGGAFRIYPSNKVEIAAGNTIKSITITCDVYNGVTCNASGDLSASSGTLSVNDTKVTIDNINSTTVTINNTSTSTGTASQLRIKSMVITYVGEGGSTGGEEGGDSEGDGDGEVEDGGNTGGEVSGNSITVDPNSFGLATNTPLTTLSLTDGTTMSFDVNGGKTKPAYYTTGGGAFRMYPSNTVEITANKTIKSISITCDVYNGTTYNASGDISASAGTLQVNDATVTINGINDTTVTITDTSTTTGAPSQFRIKSMVITYAE